MKTKISKDEIVKLYEKMNLIRLLELKVIELAKKNKIYGNLHMYIGQEAVAVGSINALDPGDVITSGHRGIAHSLAKGGDPKKVIAELMGKETGYCHGKAGKMHLAIPEIGMMGAHGIVGSGIPLATGMALHFKMNNSNNIAVSFFGDGAVNHGYFHEAINLASSWKLPILFICENNFYAISTNISSAMSSKNLISRASSYDIPAISINGMDVIEVYEKTLDCVKSVRNGNGPCFIEAKTYRFRGHHEKDNLMYVNKKEIEEWKEKCPIKRIESLLTSQYKFEKKDFDLINKSIEITIEEAVNFGLNSSFPEEYELFNFLFS
ncbi:MAG: thiamine pyrophosphate-dependent dehydrogenase E1 component subunit alpha [Eubacteriaceae bacterium]